MFAHATVLYVNGAASGQNDGSSWEDAFTSLQDALQASRRGDEIWVAQGTYTPDVGQGLTIGNREHSFWINYELTLYGGFVGTERHVSERNPKLNLTRLSGDLLGNDNDVVALDEPTRQDNSYHVVQVEYFVGPYPVLDGFIISGGHANRTRSIHIRGGGILTGASARLALRHMRVEHNVALNCGGAIYSSGVVRAESSEFVRNYTGGEDTWCGGGAVTIWYQDSVVPMSDQTISHFEDVVFRENRTCGLGGALDVKVTPIRVKDAVFEANEAGIGGGAVYFYEMRGNRSGLVAPYNQTIMTNVFFYGNISTGPDAFGGGALLLDDRSVVTLINGVFSGNVAEGGTRLWRLSALGGAVSLVERSELHVYNSVFTNNTAGLGGGLSIMNSTFAMYNSIEWANSSVSGPSIHYLDGSSSTLAHNILSGLPSMASDGGGNLQGNPGFVQPLGADGIAGTSDDDFRLLPTSIARDTGSNDLLPPDLLDADGDGDTAEAVPLDIRNQPRIWSPSYFNVPDVDLGPYELAEINVGVEDEISAAQGPTSIEVYPHPVSERSEIRLTLEKGKVVEVILYDLQGRQVAVLYDRYVGTATTISVPFYGHAYASGVYVLGVRVGEKNEHRLFVVHK